MSNKATTIQALIFICTFTIFFSCNKELGDTSNTTASCFYSKSGLMEIPVYENAEEIFEIINTVNDFEELGQLVSYETQAGRVSIGRLSDVFYNEINPNSFSDKQSALNYCINNKTYLDTVNNGVDDISVYPKWFDSPYRYVANINGLFQVGNYITRLFKHGTVTTHKNNIDLLLNLTDDDWRYAGLNFYISTKNNETKTIPHPGCLPSSVAFVDTSKKGSDYIMILSLYSTCEEYNPIAPPPGIDPLPSGEFKYSMIVSVKNKKKIAGIWWLYENLITCSGTTTPHFDSIGNDTWSTCVSTINYTAKRKSTTINAFSFIGGPSCKIHHYEYNLSVTAPGYPNAAHLQYTHP